jgi:hypothetical protein
MSHLVRRNGIYWFRADLPKDLAGKSFSPPLPDSLHQLASPQHPGRFKTAVWKSLRTSNEREAKRKVALDIVVHEALFAAGREFMRGAEPLAFSPEKTPELVHEYKRFILTVDEMQRKAGFGTSSLLEIPTSNREQPRGMSGLDLAAYSQWIEERESEVKRALASDGPPKRVASFADHLLTRCHIDPNTVTQDQRRQLEFDLLAGEREAIAQVRARLAGEVIPTPEPPSTGIENGAWTISKAFKVWEEGGSAKGAKKPGDNTIIETEAALRRFIDLYGDMPVREINKQHGREYRDAIAKVPKGLPARLAKLPLKTLLQQDLSSYPPRSARTINKILTLLAAVVSRAERDGHFDDLAWRNPFDVPFGLNEIDEDSYEPFSLTELAALIALPVFACAERPVRGRGETAKWAPLLALFHGSRRTETLQLLVRDISKDEDTGIWTVRFRTDADTGKRIKTSSSVRRIPVHPQLLSLGFEAFLH